MSRPDIYQRARDTFARAEYVSRTWDRIAEQDRAEALAKQSRYQKWLEGAHDFVHGVNTTSQPSNTTSVLVGEDAQTHSDREYHSD